MSLLASSSGHVEFSGRAFQVKPLLDIPANVDFSTGDINFLGDVCIHGDICSGFTVRAIGNITVGDHAKVGANAVVLCDVPPYATAVGVPARIIIRDPPE